MRDPPVALARLGVAHGCGCDGGGGTGRREPAGVRRISNESGLIALLSSATRVGGQRSAHQGSRTSSDDVLGGRRRGPAAEVGRSSRRSRCRASPGSWIRRGSAGSCCGDVPKVRKVQGSLKTRDFGGAGTHRCAAQEESSCCRARSRAKSVRMDSGAHGEASAAALVAWEEVKR